MLAATVGLEPTTYRLWRDRGDLNSYTFFPGKEKPSRAIPQPVAPPLSYVATQFSLYTFITINATLWLRHLLSGLPEPLLAFVLLALRLKI